MTVASPLSTACDASFDGMREAAGDAHPNPVDSSAAAPSRLLFVIDTLEVGGTEKSLLELCCSIDRSLFEAVVCQVYPGSGLAPAFARAGVRVISLNVRRKYGFISAYRRLRNVVASERPALIHSMLFRANQVSRAVGRSLCIPVVTSFVNVPYSEERRRAEPALRRWKLDALRRLDAWTSRWVAQFHSVSIAARDSNCGTLGVAADRVAVIPRGREPAPLFAVSDRRTILQNLGLPDSTRIILNVGRLIPQKGQRTLIDAMRGIVDHHPDAHLLIAGEGQSRSELCDHIARLGMNRHVTLLGYRNDVPALLNLADCFAFPSLFEGMPGAIVEAMFAGCPVVASDIPMLEGVIDSGTTGLLVPAGDSAALAHGIVHVLSNSGESRQLAQAARRAAEERFDHRAVAAAMQDFWARALASSRSERRGHT